MCVSSASLCVRKACGVDLRGPHEVAEGEIEVRGSIGHVGECRVEALELAEDQVAVGASVGLGEF